MGQMKFIADLHFGHKNILAYDNRRFPDIETHDREIVRLWNEHTSPEDEVWILGDISWLNPSKTAEIFNSLNGRLRLIVGNHDHGLIKKAAVRECFEELADYKELRLSAEQTLVLCHYPIPCFNNHYLGWTHLYGHVHASFEWSMTENARYQMEQLYMKPCDMINVGCMLPYMEYYPLTLDEIKFRYSNYYQAQQKEGNQHD